MATTDDRHQIEAVEVTYETELKLPSKRKNEIEHTKYITFWIRERSCGKMALCSLVKTIGFS